eukprot:6195171-Pleurochrysis_carterae.AAC.1
MPCWIVRKDWQPIPLECTLGPHCYLPLDEREARPRAEPLVFAVSRARVPESVSSRGGVASRAALPLGQPCVSRGHSFRLTPPHGQQNSLYGLARR